MSEKSKSVVGIGEKLGFMSYSCAANIVYNFKSLYYMIFLTNVLQIPVLTTGFMMSIGTAWDVINDPLIGVWANNIKFKNGEKIRPFLLYLAIPWAVGMVLLFTDFNASQSVAVILSLVVFFFYEIANTFRGIVYNGMGGLASNNDNDRTSINAFRSIGGCLGSGIGAVAVTPLVRLFGGLQTKDAIIGKGDAKALFLTALFMGGLCILGCIIHYFTTKERVSAIEEEEEKVSIIDTYKMLFKCKSWVWNMFFIMGYGMCNTLIMTAINYYAAYILGSSAAATPILAYYLLVSIAVSFITPFLVKAYGAKKTTFIAVIIQVIGKIPFIINPYSMTTIYINAITTGIGSTIAFIMFNTFRNQISDVVELQNGRRLDAMVSTGDNLAAKLAEAGVAIGISFALDAAGFDQALGIAQTLATKETICAIIGIVPTIVLALSLICVKKLDIEKEKQIALAKKGEQ